MPRPLLYVNDREPEPTGYGLDAQDTRLARGGCGFPLLALPPSPPSRKTKALSGLFGTREELFWRFFKKRFPGPSGGRPGPSWGRLRPSWGRLEVVLGPSWGRFGPSWGRFGPPEPDPRASETPNPSSFRTPSLRAPKDRTTSEPRASEPRGTVSKRVGGCPEGLAITTLA